MEDFARDIPPRCARHGAVGKTLELLGAVDLLGRDSLGHRRTCAAGVMRSVPNAWVVEGTPNEPALRESSIARAGSAANRAPPAVSDTDAPTMRSTVRRTRCIAAWDLARPTTRHGKIGRRPGESTVCPRPQRRCADKFLPFSDG